MEAQLLQMQAKEHRALPRSHQMRGRNRRVYPTVSAEVWLKKKLTFLKFPDFRLVKLCFYCHKPFSLCHFNMPIQIVTCNTDIISLFSDLNEINLKIIKKEDVWRKNIEKWSISNIRWVKHWIIFVIRKLINSEMFH